jgi:quinol monooxygenase YgiN
MIVVRGTITIDPDKRAAALAGSVPYQLATRNDEPGCLAYVFAADPCEANVISVFELWEDAPSLAAHFEHANYFAMRAHLHASGITGADTWKHRIDGTARVYNADRKATVDFD